MSDDTITIPDATDDEARVLLAAKMSEAGFDYFADGVFWELPGQTISVLLTEDHNDVFFYGDTTFRLHYETPQLLLGDWDTLMGVEAVEEVAPDPDAELHYQQDAPPVATPDPVNPNAPGPLTVTTPEVRSGF
jgi:hypothetical protein